MAYCTAVGLSRGHLVYAKGNEPAASHVVRHAGVAIVQHALDLDQPPAVVLGQVAFLAARIIEGNEPSVGVIRAKAQRGQRCRPES